MVAMVVRTRRKRQYRLARDDRPFVVGVMAGDGSLIPRSHLERQGFDLFKSAMDDIWHLRASKAAGGNGSQLPPSSEIREDVAQGWLTEKQGIPPPYDFDLLYQLTTVNITHATAISTKAGDFAYNGWQLVERPEVRALGISEIEVDRAREEVQDWLVSCVDGSLPIEDLVKDVAWDREAIGSGGFEVRRDVNGFIRALNHIPFHTLRATVHMANGDKNLPWYVHSRFKVQARYFAAFNSTIEFGFKKAVRFDPLRAPIVDFPQLSERKNFLRRIHPFMSRTKEKDKTSKIDDSATEFYMLARPPKTESTIYGQPAAYSAYACMLGQLKADLYNLEFFNAKGVPQYAIIMKNASSQLGYNQSDDTDSEAEAMAAIREYFQKHLKAADRSTLIISCRKDSDVTFEKLSPDSIDASFLEYEKRCDERIRVAHETPPAAMGIIQTANLGSGRESAQMARYRDHIVSPGQRVFAAVINELIRSALLIPYFRFEFLPMPVDDEASRREFKLSELKQGSISVNEYRRETGRIPFTTTEQGKDFGDALILPTAQVTIIMPSGEIVTTKPGDEPRINPAPNPKVPSQPQPSTIEGGDAND